MATLRLGVAKARTGAYSTELFRLPFPATQEAFMLPLLMPGLTEWWPILILALLLFGATKLPALARSMGSSITQFKKGLKDDDPELPEKASGEAEKAAE